MDDATGQFIIKSGFGLILAAIAWTVVASFVFLFGTGLLHDFPHPFWQWWQYALNFDGNPRVALWLKISAAIGTLPPLALIAAMVVRGRRVVGPRLRRPLFGGMAASPLAVTDNHGHAEWMSICLLYTSIFPIGLTFLIFELAKIMMDVVVCIGPFVLAGYLFEARCV